MIIQVCSGIKTLIPQWDHVIGGREMLFDERWDGVCLSEIFSDCRTPRPSKLGQGTREINYEINCFARGPRQMGAAARRKTTLRIKPLFSLDTVSFCDRLFSIFFRNPEGYCSVGAAYFYSTSSVHQDTESMLFIPGTAKFKATIRHSVLLHLMNID